MHEHVLALRRRELLEQPRRDRVELAAARPEQLDPVRGLVLERVERRTGRLPKPRQQRDEDVERRLLPRRRERRPGLAPLEQQRAPLVVAREQPDRAVAVPELERIRLMLRFAIRRSQLQHHRRPVSKLGAHRESHGPGRVRLAEPQSPLLATLVDELPDAHRRRIA